MIIWIDGTFGIGKTAVAYELQNKYSGSDVIDFDDFIKTVRIENPWKLIIGKRYPEDKKSYVDSLVDCLNKKISTNQIQTIIVPITLITDYCKERLIEEMKNRAETIHFILYSSKEKLLERIEKQDGRDVDLAITYYDEATSYLKVNYKDAIRIDTENMTIGEITDYIEKCIEDRR